MVRFAGVFGLFFSVLALSACDGKGYMPTTPTFTPSATNTASNPTASKPVVDPTPTPSVGEPTIPTTPAPPPSPAPAPTVPTPPSIPMPTPAPVENAPVETLPPQLPKTCAMVDQTLNQIRVRGEGNDTRSVFAVPDFKSVTINGNQILIEVSQNNAIVDRYWITRDHRGVEVRIGNYNPGDAPKNYTARLWVSDDQAQNCVSPQVVFTIPAKASSACDSSFGRLSIVDQKLLANALQFTVLVSLDGNQVRGTLSTPNTPFIPVNDGSHYVMEASRPEKGRGPGSYLLSLSWTALGTPCRPSFDLRVTVPEKP